MSKVEQNIGKGVYNRDRNLREERSQPKKGVSAEVRKIGTEEVREYGGLCSICAKSSTCTYRREPLQPVWECDDFEIETISVNISAPTASPLKSIAEDKDPGRYAGLCVNCEHRETCTYRRPEGGVWHCEEYE